MATTSNIFEKVKSEQNIFAKVSSEQKGSDIFERVSRDVSETKDIEDLSLDELYGVTPIKKGGPTQLTKRVKESAKQTIKDFTSPKVWAKSAAQVALAPGRIALDVGKLPWAAASATGKAIDLFEDDDPRTLFELMAGRGEGIGKKIQRHSQNQIEYLDRLKNNIKPIDEEMSDTAVSFLVGGTAAAGAKAFSRKVAGKGAETAAKAGLLEPLKTTFAKGGIAAAAGDKILIDPAMKKVDEKLDQTDLSPGAKQIARSVIPIVLGITSGLYPERQLERMLSSNRFATLLEKSVTNKTLARKLYEEAFETANTHQVKEVAKEVTSNPYTKYIGEPIWDTLIQKKVPEMLERVPGGKSINRALIYGHRGSLEDADDFTKAIEATRLNQQFGLDYAVDVGSRVNKLPQVDQFKIADYIRGNRQRLPENLKGLGDEIRGTFYSLGKQAVDAGLMTEETFFKHAGRYMPRLYETKEYAQLLKKWGFKNPNRLDLSRFKKRSDIPKEIRQEMGEILTPGYPAAKGISQLTHDVALSKFFKGVASNPKWVAGDEIPEGFVKLGDNKKLGALKGKYVHPEISSEIEGFVDVLKTPEQVWRKALGAWKFGKVILSPKTHARNVMSNSFLGHLGGMPMWKQPEMLGKALKEFKGEGSLFVEAKRSGLLESTYTNAELRSLYDQVAIKLDAKGPIANKITSVGKFTAGLRKAGNKAAQAYEAEEQIFKLAKFIDNRGKGMGIQQSAADAEKWLFNYGKLTHFQELYKSKWYGAPFATFTFKSVPRVMEAAIKTPWRFALPAAMVYGLESAASEKFGDTGTQRRAKKKLAPEWMQGSFLGIPNFARMPVSDESGREYYLNLSYIFPWGDLGEGGGIGPIPGSLRPGSMPILKEGIEQLMNYDNFWKEQIVKDEDIAGMSATDTFKVQAKKRLRHAYNSMVPTIGIDIEKAIDAYRSNPDYRGRERPDFVIAMDVIGGIKMYPVDYVDQVVRKIYEVSPKNGKNARILKSQIRGLERRARAVEKKNQDGSRYRKQIDEKLEQIKGLAKETMEVRDTFYETRKNNIFDKVKTKQKKSIFDKVAEDNK